MRFVWLDVPDGGQIPVNADQVAYLKACRGQSEPRTEVVFGAVSGGLHSVIVQGDGREIAEQLELASAAVLPARPGKRQRPAPRASRPQRT